ncbi:MAG: Sb-PDE family phosphodiesterase [Ignavibacteria bacterium]|jgi:hypothetical protein
MKKLLPLFILLIPFISNAHGNLDEQRKIIFPNIPGYVTMKCDLHQHTVFSDGHVWPTVRVWEALKDNLDAIAVTEHLEYQPYKDDIPHPDRNRAYEIETKAAENNDLIIINGSEITRDMPPGHSNAIFLNDANKLIIDDPMEVFKEAKRQGAFVFWNHPNWVRQRKDGIATLTNMHRELIKNGLLNGIEIVNDITYSDEALQIALDNNLTLIGTSDIHGLVDWRYKIPEGGHRPVTLVFAKEKSKVGIKEGLENRRTVVYHNNILIGREEYLVPLVQSSISIEKTGYKGENLIFGVTLKNNSSCELILQNKSDFTFHNHSDLVNIKAQSSVELQVKTLEKLSKVPLKFEVLNGVTAPSVHPEIMLEINVK